MGSELRRYICRRGRGGHQDQFPRCVRQLLCTQRFFWCTGDAHERWTLVLLRLLLVRIWLERQRADDADERVQWLLRIVPRQFFGKLRPADDAHERLTWRVLVREFRRSPDHSYQRLARRWWWSSDHPDQRRAWRRRWRWTRRLSAWKSCRELGGRLVPAAGWDPIVCP